MTAAFFVAAFSMTATTAAMAATIVQVAVMAMTIGSMIYQRDRARKMQNQAKDEADKQRGFQLVAEAQAAPINVFYGRNKVGGTRVFHYVGDSYVYYDKRGSRSETFVNKGDVHRPGNRVNTVLVSRVQAARSLDEQKTDHPVNAEEAGINVDNGSGFSSRIYEYDKYPVGGIVAVLSTDTMSIVIPNVGDSLQGVGYESYPEKATWWPTTVINGIYYRNYGEYDAFKVGQIITLEHKPLFTDAPDVNKVSPYSYYITNISKSGASVTLTLRLPDSAVVNSVDQNNLQIPTRAKPAFSLPHEGDKINSKSEIEGYVRADTKHDKNVFLYIQQVIGYGGINRVISVEVDGKDWRDPSFDRENQPMGAFRIHTYYDGNEVDWMVSESIKESKGGTDDTLRSSAFFTNTAYASMAFRLHRGEPQFSGIPVVQFYLEGMRVNSVIPTQNGYGLSGSKSYSNNPAYCLLDYLMNPVYGKGLTEAEVDLESFYHAAKICNRKVPVNNSYTPPANGKFWSDMAGRVDGATVRDVKLYECNLGIDTSKPVRDNIEAILETMGQAELVWSGGKYKLQLEYPLVWGENYTIEEQDGSHKIAVGNTHSYHIDDVVQYSREINSATVTDLYRNNLQGTNSNVPLNADGTLGTGWTRDVVAAYLTDDDIIRDDTVTQTWPGAQNRLNYFTVRFLNESKDFAEDTVSWPSKAPSERAAVYDKFIQQDNDIPMEGETFQSGDTTEWHAKATAEERVRVSRDSTIYKLTVNLRYTYLEPGDFVKVNSDVLKIPGELARVEEVSVNDRGQAVIQLIKFDARMLAWNAKDDEVVEGRNIYDNQDLAFPTNLTWTPKTDNISFMSEFASGILTWTSSLDPKVYGHNVMLSMKPYAQINSASDFFPWSPQTLTNDVFEVSNIGVGTYTAAVVPVGLNGRVANFRNSKGERWPLIKIEVVQSFNPNKFQFELKTDNGNVYTVLSNYATPASITITANISGAIPAAGEYTWYRLDNVNTGYTQLAQQSTPHILIDRYGLDPDIPDYLESPWPADVIYRTYKCVCRIYGMVFEDTITLNKVVSGSGAFTIIQKNPSVIIPCDSTGVPTSTAYDTSGNTITAYYGAQQLSAVSSLDYLNSNSFFVTAQGEDITAGSVTASGMSATIGNSSNMLATADVAFVNYAVTVMVNLPVRVRDDPTAKSTARQTFNLEQSASKLRVGAKGNTGDNALVHYLTNLTPSITYQGGVSFNPSKVTADAYTANGTSVVAMDPCYITMEVQDSAGAVLQSAVKASNYKTNKMSMDLLSHDVLSTAKKVVISLRRSGPSDPLLDQEEIPFGSPNAPVLDLSNENTAIFVSADDTPPYDNATDFSWATSYCTATVKRDDSDETNAWTITWTPINCSIDVLDPPPGGLGRNIHVTKMTGLTAAVHCTASAARRTSLNKTMSIVAQKQGNKGIDGAPGLAKFMTVEPSFIGLRPNHTLSHSSITAYAWQTENGRTSPISGTFTLSSVGGVSSGSANGASATFNVGGTPEQNKSTSSFRISFVEANNTGFSDSETVPVGDPTVPLLDLTNESSVFPESKDPATGITIVSFNGASASSTARVIKGEVEDTGWSFNWSGSGCTPASVSGPTYTVTSMSADSAAATVVATKGGQSLSAVFSLSKAKQGNSITGPSGQSSNIVFKSAPANMPPNAPADSTGVPTGENWSDTPPVLAPGSTDVIYASIGTKIPGSTLFHWVTPVKMSAIDAKDTPIELIAYKRAPLTPTPTISGGTYTLSATGGTYVTPSGWVDSVPNGADPCWVSSTIYMRPAGVTSGVVNLSGWSTPVIAFKNGDSIKGDTGSPGTSAKVAELALYRWGNSDLPPVDQFTTYNWSTRTHSINNVAGWQLSAPANNTPRLTLYKAEKAISTTEGDTSTVNVSWTNAYVHATSVNGAPGLQVANPKCYFVGTAGDSAPFSPVSRCTYTWASQSFTGNLAIPGELGKYWTTDPDPVGPNQVLWQLTTQVSDEANVLTTDFYFTSGSATVIGYGGSDGKSGISQNTIEVYTATATSVAPTTYPSSSTTYVFSSDTLSEGNRSMPEPSPTAPFVWRSASTFRLERGFADTTPVQGDGWSPWILVAQKTYNGANGTDGSSFRTVTIYKRASGSPTPPNGGSYNFGTSITDPRVAFVSPDNSWTYDPPGITTTPTWASEYTFRTSQPLTSNGPVVFGGTWSTPVVDGQKGDPGAKGDTGANGVDGSGTIPAYAVANDETGWYPPTTIGNPLVTSTAYGSLSADPPSGNLLPGQYLMMSMGTYVPSENRTYWGKTFLATLKVGQLSAISANMGTITGGSMTIGNGEAVFKVDTGGNHWAGSSNEGSAPFSVKSTGEVKCSNITITGGSINIANRFYVDTAGSMWMNSGSYNSSTFRVSPSGDIVSNGYSLYGSVTYRVGADGALSIGGGSWDTSKFRVTPDGSLYTSAAYISGGSISGVSLLNLSSTAMTLTDVKIQGTANNLGGATLYDGTFRSPTLNNISITGSSNNLAGAVLSNGTFSYPTINAPAINYGSINNTALNSVTINNPTFAGVISGLSLTGANIADVDATTGGTSASVSVQESGGKTVILASVNINSSNEPWYSTWHNFSIGGVAGAGFYGMRNADGAVVGSCSVAGVVSGGYGYASYEASVTNSSDATVSIIAIHIK